MELRENENNFCNIKKWILGNNLGNFLLGLGTCLIGISALFALFQTSGMLDKILRIQSQADTIENGVQQIAQAVDMLRQQLIAKHAINTVENTSLKNPDITSEQIQKVIDTIPTSASCKNPIFLPEDRKGKILYQLEQVKTTEAKEEILRNALEYQAPPTCLNGR